MITSLDKLSRMPVGSVFVCSELVKSTFNRTDLYISGMIFVAFSTFIV